jgi:hypothetical protein
MNGTRMADAAAPPRGPKGAMAQARSVSKAASRESAGKRGEPVRDPQAAPSAACGVSAAQRSEYGFGSPLFHRAHISSRGPAEIMVSVPLAMMASRASVRGDRPPTTVAMISGQASSVVSNRASTLFDGINRSWYPTAPSRKNSLFSPGFRGWRLPSALLQSRWLVSGRSSSGAERALPLSTFVLTSFALRGAPCGDDPRPRAALGGYHEEKPSKRGRPDDPIAFLFVGMCPIRKPVRLLFYAVASFFLGVIAVAVGGAAALEGMFSPGGLVIGGSYEPWQTLLAAVLIATPLVFVLLAVVSIFVRPGDAPASAADIRELIAAMEGRDSSVSPAIDRPLGGRH